jgi:3'-phosphoadenosine 5'-phosphosulfate sulfotransferase (PAPS reductase)/FAD synthetase
MLNMTDHLVMFSGGAGSWATAKRVASTLPEGDRLRLVFADTMTEDEDLYRFLAEAAANVGGELVRLADGRDIWEVFHDKRYLGNTRVDPCSKILKRDLIRKWMEENYPYPSTVVVYLGIDWTEEHRFTKALPYWAPYKVRAPMCDAPYLDKGQVLQWMESEGIKRPRLYDMGFPHNNCGGFCVKAGQAHFKLLLEKMPERYAYHEAKEEELRQYLGKDVAIMRDRRGGATKPLTMKAFRERLDADGSNLDADEWGGCACFTPDDYAATDDGTPVQLTFPDMT